MSRTDSDSTSNEQQDGPDRRGFLAQSSSIVMLCGLAGGYGTFVYMAGRFLYESNTESHDWRFLAPVDELKLGDSLTYVAPSGAKIVIARQDDKGQVDDFIALSNICPHLGCQVHWEPQNERFFCPCHNGAFDRQGKATEGPPEKAKQSLKRFPLRIENGLLEIETPLYTVGQESSALAACGKINQDSLTAQNSLAANEPGAANRPSQKKLDAGGRLA